MSLSTSRILQLLLIAACCALAAQAQLTVSAIRGTVTDGSGAPVTNAAIKVADLGTGYERKTATNNEGFYEVPDLLSGSFRVTVTAPGFSPFIADDIKLASNEIRRIDAALNVGSIKTATTVEANAAVITTEGPKLQSTLSKQEYLDKPWVGNGINPLLLLTAKPLVQNTGSIFGIQVAGQSTAQIQSTIDGIGADSTLNGTNINFYSEVNAVTGNNSAEFPRVAHISMISSSATNQFHGLLQYWNQTSALAAKDYFAQVKPESLTHNMDAEFGGPVIKNKTFFLFNWEGQRIPSGTYYVSTVPTAAMRTGNFSQTSAVIHDTNGVPFPQNQIPVTRINSVSQNILNKFLPAPNLGTATTTARNFGYTFPYPSDLFYLDNYMWRIDHKFSEKNTIFARWQFANVKYVLAGNDPSLFYTRSRKTYNFALEDTHIVSARTVNTARFGLYQPTYVDGNTIDGRTPLHGAQVLQSLGLQGVDASRFPQEGFPSTSISGYSTLTVQPGGEGQNYKEWHFADTLSTAAGRHFLRMGAELRSASQFSGSIPDGTFGSYAFNGSITGNAFADFLLGVPYSSSRVNPIIDRTQQDWELGIFLQDTYRVSKRLTLNLGIRWDRFGSANYADNLVYNWDINSGDVIVPQSSLSKVSSLYPANIVVVAGDAHPHSSNLNFVPRLGVAYQLTPTFVLRGGYGIYNETLGRFARAQGGGPYQIAETYYNSSSAPGGYFAWPNAFPTSIASVSIPSQSVSGFPTGTSNGRIHQFNVTLEKQIANVGIRLTYLGSRSLGLNYTLQIDKPMPSTKAFVASSRPWPQFAGVTYARDNGEAKFDAFTIEGMRRMGPLSFDAHYTLASNMNDMQNLENPYRALTWSRDPSTTRNRAVFNIGYQLPVGKGQHFLPNMKPWEDAIVGGWHVEWITYLQSGQYYSPSFSGSDPSGTNTSGGLPNCIGNPNLPSDQRSINHWFNTAAFAVPSPGTFGNCGANVIEGPGLQMSNTSLIKSFRFFERLKLTLGAAVQNTFNHPNFTSPALNISTPGTAGVISSTLPFGGARQVMLRGRFDF
jgi:hypothetical protein